MGLWNTSKKVTKFTLVSMPLSILGINHLRMGYKQITDLWKSLSNPVCPNCYEGIMKAENSGEEKMDSLRPWVCNKCGFGFLDSDLSSARKTAISYRNKREKTELAELPFSERENIARGHRFQSRAFFIASALALLGFFYLLASGARILIASNWLAVGVSLWFFGMKKSYRSWQCTTGSIFVNGSFWLWFKNEKWIV